MKKILLLLFVCCSSKLNAQKIYFSQKDVTRYDMTNNYIVGKIKNNIIVLTYLQHAMKFEFLIYNYNMQLQKKVPVDFLPVKNFSLNYINRQDHFDLILQYYKGKNFYCCITSIDEEGKMMCPFKMIDSIENTNADGNDVYGIVESENKKQLCLIKAFTGIRPGTLLLDYLLVDGNFNIMRRKKNLVPFDNTISISPLYLDNAGNLIFAEYRMNPLPQTQSTLVTIYKIEKDNDTALNTVHEVLDCSLKNLSIEINNDLNRYVVTGMIQKKAAIDSSNTLWEQGIFTSLLNADLSSTANDTIIFLYKTVNFEMLTGKVVALNNIIAKNDGGYIVACSVNGIPAISGHYFARPPSSVLTTSEPPFYAQPYLNSTINKIIYTPANGRINRNYYDPSNSMPPENSGYTMSFEKNQSGNNLVLLNLDDSNKVKWSLVLDGKMEKDVASLINDCKGIHTGSILHFVYARMINKNKKVFSEIEIKSNGTYEIKPLIMNDLHYDMQVQSGVQVDDKSIVFPCSVKDKLAFVRVEFE